jgi:uncharacterized membrane protein YGL010W
VISKKLQKYFNDYSEFHKTSGNKITHYFGITFIVVSILGLLSEVVFRENVSTIFHYLRIDAAVLLLLCVSVWYLLADFKVAIPFLMILIGCYFLGRSIPSYLNWILFALGWILQGIGHAVYEKKSPAFFQNLVHLLIGPLWIFARFMGYK